MRSGDKHERKETGMRRARHTYAGKRACTR